jgi:phage terminase large subunit GpA-like protein
MNWYYDDTESFFSEGQNDPQDSADSKTDSLSLDDVMSRVNGEAQATVPIGATELVAYIDVHGALLYWIVLALGDGFTGWVLDYGTFPDTGRRYFRMSEIRAGIDAMYPGISLEGRTIEALRTLTGILLPKDYHAADGGTRRISCCPIDANWGQTTDAVYEFCRTSPYSGIVIPSHGRYVGAAHAPWDQFRQRRGEKLGTHWTMPPGSSRRGVRHLLIDTNWWKSFVHARFILPPGERGSFSLWGHKPERHQLFAEHVCSESVTHTSGHGRSLDEWRETGKFDNHLWDCIVGAAVAGSYRGIQIFSGERKRRTLAPFAEIRSGA